MALEAFEIGRVQNQWSAHQRWAYTNDIGRQAVTRTVRDKSDTDRNQGLARSPGISLLGRYVSPFQSGPKITSDVCSGVNSREVVPRHIPQAY